MRRFLSVILTILYLSTSSGAVVHTHYCMGEIAEWGLGHSESEFCSKCGMKTSDTKGNDCCKDVFQILEHDASQKVSGSDLQPIQVMVPILPLMYLPAPQLVLPSSIEESAYSNAPIRPQSVEVYIRNCVFRI